MRHITYKLALIAMLVLATTYSGATLSPEEQRAKMQSMSVAELEQGGDLARIHKDYPLAIEYFRTALRNDRKNAVIFNKLGMAELKNNELEAARRDFAKAAKYNPKYADAVNNIGAVDYIRKNYGSAAKNFKKAIALNESLPSYHVNLGAAWFAQKKMDRAIAEYTRALELDPDALKQESKVGVAAQIASPEERAKYSYMMAKIYARRGDMEGCLQCLRKAKEDGYREMANVYRDEEFSRMRDDPRLHEVVPPPAK